MSISIKSIRNKLTSQRFFQFLLANVIFSISTFLINLSLPIILSESLYDKFIYLFHMVFFITTLFQFGMVVGLYKFYDKYRKEIFNIYYTLVLLINVVLLLFSLKVDNFINVALKITDITVVESFSFYCSVIVLGIFLFNKGKNIIEKSFKYMLKISMSVFIIRIFVIVFLFIIHIESLSILLFLFFILPFFRDIIDYVKSTIKFVRPNSLNFILLRKFLYFIFNVWIIGMLFTISDKIFLISTKGLNQELTTAIAFSSGFVGIISLFNSTFSNFFLAKLSSNNLCDIDNYLKQLIKFLPKYFVLLLLICIIFSLFILLGYSQFGIFTSTITFITLLRMGFISYLGLFTLLGKILDLLHLEIVLNILRILVVYILCNFWVTDNYVLWYAVVVFVVPFPELILTFVIRNKVNSRIKKSNIESND